MSLSAHIAAARAAAAGRRLPEAAAHYRAAIALKPDDGNLHRNLGVLLLAQGQLDEARAILTTAVQLSPEVPAIRLQLARACEQTGDGKSAITHYFRALVQAQMREQWLDQASTPRGLWPLVQHAAQVAAPGRKDILLGLLAPQRERFGRTEMHRVESALLGYLGLAGVRPASPAQRPRFLYFPELRTQRFYAPAEFAWIDALQAATDDIRAEAEAALQRRAELQPFLEFQEADEAKHYLGESEGAAWDAYFFFRGGARFDHHHELSPRTSAALAGCDLVRIREHAPEVCFSILAPGTHILPHTGVSNIRLVAHLPLLIPPEAALTVAGETHVWQPGRVVVFDDTFEHEAWNRSEATRVILLMDTWHPDLRDSERAAITAIIEGIGEFHRG